MIPVAASGCSPFSSGAFTCAESAQCDVATGGVCQANGRCSFPDQACPSGQRYGDLSGDLSGVCVGEEPPDTLEPGQPDAAPPSGDWWDTGFAARHRIDVSFTPQAGDLDDFPALVILDSARVDYGAIDDAGADLRFIAADNTTELAYEIERYDEAGNSYIWVEVPRIATAGGSHFYLYHGNPQATDGQDPAAVWNADHHAVWHLAELVTDESQAGSHADSTSNNITGTQRNNSSADDSVGCIAGCQSFDGNGDRIVIAENSVQITGTAITIEARARMTSAPVEFPHVYGAGSDGRFWQIFWYRDIDGWSNRYRVNGSQRENYTSDGAVNAWATLASVYDGTNVRLFLDGVPIASTGATGDLSAPNTDLWLGANPGLPGRQFTGLIDEVRISNVVRSDEWLQAQHLSLTDGLLTIGAAEPRP